MAAVTPLRRLAAALLLLAAPLAALASCTVSSGASEPSTTRRISPAPSPRAGHDDDDDDDDDDGPATKAAYADMGRTLGTVTLVPVRGRLVKENGQPDLLASTPKKEMSQREIKRTPVEIVVLNKEGKDRLTLGSTQSDSEGYINASFALKEGALEPGLHTLEVRVQGRSAGRTTARLLDVGFTGLVVRSDVDLTYLDTHFARKRDMLSLLGQSARERATLPAMERVYSALRAGASGSEDRALVFISGSPRFFKRVLEARMTLDGVDHDALLLKPFDEMVWSRMISLDLGAIVPALKEQVGYKLVHLMNGRLELPPKAGELLLGDDSEADYIVYSIYHRFMAGDLDIAELDKELGRAGLDASQREPVKALALKVRSVLPPSKVVHGIYINRTGFPNQHHSVKDWVVNGLTRYHTGAWPLILDLYEEGFVSKEAVTAVRKRLLELGQVEKDLEAAREDGIKSGFLKRETVAAFGAGGATPPATSK
jgi:hypothetical protein